MKKIRLNILILITCAAPIYAAEVKEGAQAKENNALNMTLAQAIYRLDVDGVVNALKQGANPNARFLVLLEGNIEFPMQHTPGSPCIFILIEKVTSIYTPIDLEAQNTIINILSALLEFKANINAEYQEEHASPLFYLCDFFNKNDRYFFLVKALVEKGKADVNLQNVWKVTPLMKAAQSGEVATFKFLLENGADITMRDVNGNDIRHWIDKSGKKAELIKILNESKKTTAPTSTEESKSKLEQSTTGE